MLEIKNLVLGFHTCAGINIWVGCPVIPRPQLTCYSLPPVNIVDNKAPRPKVSPDWLELQLKPVKHISVKTSEPNEKDTRIHLQGTGSTRLCRMLKLQTFLRVLQTLHINISKDNKRKKRRFCSLQSAKELIKPQI